MMKHCRLIILLAMMLGLMSPGGAAAVSVSPSGVGDALIFALIETTNLDTLIALENSISNTVVARVRFRDLFGAESLVFDVCLVPRSTWTASVIRDGSLTRVTSTSTLRINGVPGPFTAPGFSLAGSPTEALLEVIGLREANTSPVNSTTVCTDSTTGRDVESLALSGRVYYVKGIGSTPLVYGANAVALLDFATTKIVDGTVLQNDPVAQALIAQGGSGSDVFFTRYFIPASFGAITQVVLAFPTGPTSAGCPNCRVPGAFTVFPFTDAGAALPILLLSGSIDTLIRVVSLSSSDIAADSGLLIIRETSLSGPLPAVGFAINTTTASAPLFFNALFPINIR